MNSKQPMKIIGIIAQLEQELEASPRPKLGQQNRRLVDLDILRDLLGDLKATVPEDVRRAHTVLQDSEVIYENAKDQADGILLKAQEQADEILEAAEEASMSMARKAQEEFERRIAEEPVMFEANQRAQELLYRARETANVLYNGSKQYADDILFDVQRYLGEYIALVQKNREELGVRYELEEEKPEALSDSAAGAAPADGFAPEEQTSEPEPDEALPAKKARPFERARRPRPRPAHEIYFEEEEQDARAGNRAATPELDLDDNE